MAEFVAVMRQLGRLCKAQKNCVVCPIHDEKGQIHCRNRLVCEPSCMEEIIMNWAAERPEKTMKDVFFEKFPNAPRDELGDPRMCPLDVGFPARPDGAGYEGECHTEKPCTGCWNRPAPEE